MTFNYNLSDWFWVDYYNIIYDQNMITYNLSLFFLIYLSLLNNKEEWYTKIKLV